MMEKKNRKKTQLPVICAPNTEPVNLSEVPTRGGTGQGVVCVWSDFLCSDCGEVYFPNTDPSWKLVDDSSAPKKHLQ